jgi:bacterial leucyl aminopeptidase
MKFLRSIFFFVFLTGLTVIATNCKRDDNTETVNKDAIILKITQDISADSLQYYVTWMQGLGTRFALSNGHRNVALNIRNKFIGMGYTDTRIDSFWINKTYKTINYQQWQYNVIATLQGRAGSDSISIIGGHYDDYLNSGDPFTIDPGANDNASGAAAALEVARVMKKNSYIPENTIQFIAFGAEEMGLLGSAAYAADARSNLKPIKFMLNNDMIAYEPDNNTSNWSVNILDYSNSHYIRTEAEQLCTKFTILKYYTSNTYNNASDSYSFYSNGYKALFFFSNKMDPNYHTLIDLVTNCNFAYCKEIVKLNCAMLVNKN